MAELAFAQVGAPGEDPFDLEGDVLDGQIRIIKLVGEGELSIVYRGVHEGMNAPVAIKCLNLPATLDPELVEPIAESFREGARVHYRLAQGHLQIARTLALGTTLAPRTGQQVPYIVREWLDGRSLADDFAAREASATRPRTSSQAFELLDSAADAIAHAHSEGVCHHALAPRNLFLVKAKGREVLKVLDFGMARSGALANNTNKGGKSSAGLRLLSSQTAPEQLDARLGAPCAATDVYAFALVLFEAVTGRPYFAPNTHVSEVLRIAEAREPLAPNSSGPVVPRDLEAVLSRALAPKPRDRYGNLRVFWDDVRRAVQRAPLPAPLTHGSRSLPAVRLSTPPRPSLVVTEPSPTAAPVPPPLPVVVERPSASSCTAEVAPPVTMSAVVEDEPASEPAHDTIPAPPIAEPEQPSIDVAARADGSAEDGAVAIPVFGGTVAAQWTKWSLVAKRLYEQHVATAKPVALGATAFGVIVLLASAAVIGPASSSARPAASAATGVEPQSPRVVGSDPATLALADTRRYVAPKSSAFDRAVMQHAFDETAADLESCTHPGGPRGPGSIRLIILPSGKIMRLQIGPPYAGTPTGACISKRFVDTTYPSFTGPPRTMNYLFNTISFSSP